MLDIPMWDIPMWDIPKFPTLDISMFEFPMMDAPIFERDFVLASRCCVALASHFNGDRKHNNLVIC